MQFYVKNSACKLKLVLNPLITQVSKHLEPQFFWKCVFEAVRATHVLTVEPYVFKTLKAFAEEAVKLVNKEIILKVENFKESAPVSRAPHDSHPLCSCQILRQKLLKQMLFSGTHLHKAADLFNRRIETEEVERLASHRRQVRHAHGFLLGERQVPVHPHLPLGLRTQLIQTSDFLICGGGRIGLLQRQQGEKK